MIDTLKTVIITGGNTGLGFACAKHIMESNKGWYVLIASSNQEKSKQAVEKLISETGKKDISFLKLDLSSFQSVRDFVNSFLKSDYPPLHGIICNAGISLSDEITTTPDGIETAFQVNCLGHYLLVNLLGPYLKAQSRLLFVSSEVHRNDGSMKRFRPDYKNANTMAYPEKPLIPIEDSGTKRYSATKLCLLFYTYELSRRLSLEQNSSITVNSFNPGLMPDTGLGGLNKMFFTKYFLKYILPFFAKGAVSSPKISGRILAELLIDDKYKNITGKYFDRDKVIPSSEESYDKLKWLDLWNTSSAIVGIDPQSAFPL